MAHSPAVPLHGTRDQAQGVDALRGLAGRLVASRPQRVLLIVVACMLMGLTDLLCTLAYVGNVGMIEKNPVARMVINQGGAFWLVCFKLMTMLITGGCISMSRRHAVGEHCAWLCAVLLGTLTLHWIGYNKDIVSPENIENVVPIATSPEMLEVNHWVRFED